MGARPVTIVTLFPLLSLAPSDDQYGNPPGSASVVTRIPPLFVSSSAADSIAGGFWLFIVFFPRDFPLGAETENRALTCLKKREMFRLPTPPPPSNQPLIANVSSRTCLTFVTVSGR